MPRLLKYEKPYLYQVILRVDLASPLKNLSVQVPPAIQSEIVSRFPVLEAVDKIRQSQEEPEWVQRSQWSFYNLARTKRFACTPYEFFIDCLKYESFESLRADFVPILQKFIDVDPTLAARRVGLRYLNRIDLGLADRAEFAQFIRNDLLSGFTVITGQEQSMARSLQNVSWNYGELMLNFHYGIPNPDFPSPILKNEFVLDIDVHSQITMELREIPTKLEDYHQRVQSVFEAVILDPLRQRMVAVYE